MDDQVWRAVRGAVDVSMRAAADSAVSREVNVTLGEAVDYAVRNVHPAARPDAVYRAVYGAVSYAVNDALSEEVS